MSSRTYLRRARISLGAGGSPSPDRECFGKLCESSELRSIFLVNVDYDKDVSFLGTRRSSSFECVVDKLHR